MTHRTESTPPTRVEIATSEAIEGLSEAITAAHRKHKLNEAHGMTEAEFRRMLVLYLSELTPEQWASALRVADPRDPGERGQPT